MLVSLNFPTAILYSMTSLLSFLRVGLIFDISALMPKVGDTELWLASHVQVPSFDISNQKKKRKIKSGNSVLVIMTCKSCIFGSQISHETLHMSLGHHPNPNPNLSCLTIHKLIEKSNPNIQMIVLASNILAYDLFFGNHLFRLSIQPNFHTLHQKNWDSNSNWTT